MTSLAFLLGIVPLVVSTGAGSAARRSLGTAVFGGMLAATAFTILFVPMFYVVIPASRGSSSDDAALSKSETRPAFAE